MIPSTLIVLATLLSSLGAANGAIFQRDGGFTFTSPQPTSSTTTSSVMSPTTTVTIPVTTSSTTSNTSPVTTSSVPVASSVPTTTSKSIPVTTSSVPTTTTKSIPVTTSSVPVTSSVPPTTTKSIPVTTSSVPVTSSVPATPSTPTPTPTGTVNCNNAQNWLADFAYTAGAQVIFNNQLWTAGQWTYNNDPPYHPDQWTLVGTCTQPIKNQVDCSGVSAWQNSVAYTSGNKVTFGGHLWSAVSWSFNSTPGGTAGVWQDLGACVV